MDTGLIHIYCGDGKGKTTASLGWSFVVPAGAARSSSRNFSRAGRRANWKPQSPDAGHGPEGKSHDQVHVPDDGRRKKRDLPSPDNTVAKNPGLLRKASPDLAVCDELVGACALGLVPEEQVIHFLKGKPAHTEVVLTGRNPSPALLDLADYVSEIKKIKHPFDRGIAARIGIEE